MMSSLDMINACYDSDSDNEDIQFQEKSNNIGKTKAGKTKLPLPEKFHNEVQNSFDVNDTDKHQGRLRSFKHERGNWATFVCISYAETTQSYEFYQYVTEIISSQLDTGESGVEWSVTEDFHLSLSRTVTIPHHFIDPLVQSLHSKLINLKQFTISFSSSDLRFYVNDEKTRSFLGFEITSTDTQKLIKNLVDTVDETFVDYRCDKFYEEASYHLSVAWCLGDLTGRKDCEKMLEDLKRMWTKVEDSAEYLFSFEVNEIVLKCGNKSYIFPFK